MSRTGLGIQVGSAHRAKSATVVAAGGAVGQCPQDGVAKHRLEVRNVAVELVVGALADHLGHGDGLVVVPLDEAPVARAPIGNRGFAANEDPTECALERGLRGEFAAGNGSRHLERPGHRCREALDAPPPRLCEQVGDDETEGGLGGAGHARNRTAGRCLRTLPRSGR